MRNSVVAYYTYNEDTYNIEYVKLVNLSDNSVFLIKNEQDFIKHKDSILYKDARIKISNYAEFLEYVSIISCSLSDIKEKNSTLIAVVLYINCVKILDICTNKV